MTETQTDSGNVEQTPEAAAPEAATPEAATPEAAAPEAATPEGDTAEGSGESVDELPPEAPPADSSDAPQTDSMETPAEPESESESEEAPEIDGIGGPVELPELPNEAAYRKLVDAAVDALAVQEGTLHAGTVTEITDDTVTIDLGEERIGSVPRDEFMAADGSMEIEVGTEVAVYLESLRGTDAEISHEKAEKLLVWNRVNTAVRSRAIVSGQITGRVKGGLSVDIGVKAFLPGSQVDIRPSRNVDRYIGKTYDFQVIKFDKKRGNIVLSRRAMLEKERAGLKEETLQKLKVGERMNGIVKNTTEYGCFVDLGGIDGLLHVTDMSWGRLNHPRDMVKSGDELEVLVLKFDPETERVSLGLKQITENPWMHVDQKYQVGQLIEGKVVSTAEYGAFVEIEQGVEGLIHVSEMSWTKRIKHPNDVVTKGEEIQAVILGIDNSARRISLGLKQTQPNPWTLLQDRYPVGSRVRAKVRNVTNFGVFLGIEEGIDGLIHVSDLAWGGKVNDPNDSYTKGDEIEAVVLNIDVKAERFSLGVKQLSDDPWHKIEDRYAIGQVVEGRVKKLLDFGAIVQLEENVEGLVHVSELSEDRVEDVSSVVKAGETVRAMVLSLSADERKMGLSIKRLDEADQAADLEEFTKAQAPARTTIGDLIKAKIDVSSLPAGPGPEADAPASDADGEG